MGSVVPTNSSEIPPGAFVEPTLSYPERPLELRRNPSARRSRRALPDELTRGRNEERSGCNALSAVRRGNARRRVELRLVPHQSLLGDAALRGPGSHPGLTGTARGGGDPSLPPPGPRARA